MLLPSQRCPSAALTANGWPARRVLCRSCCRLALFELTPSRVSLRAHRSRCDVNSSIGHNRVQGELCPRARLDDGGDATATHATSERVAHDHRNLGWLLQQALPNVIAEDSHMTAHATLGGPLRAIWLETGGGGAGGCGGGGGETRPLTGWPRSSATQACTRICRMYCTLASVYGQLLAMYGTMYGTMYCSWSRTCL